LVTIIIYFLNIYHPFDVLLYNFRVSFALPSQQAKPQEIRFDYSFLNIIYSNFFAQGFHPTLFRDFSNELLSSTVGGGSCEGGDETVESKRVKIQIIH
jgi:hypothetical protein